MSKQLRLWCVVGLALILTAAACGDDGGGAAPVVEEDDVNDDVVNVPAVARISSVGFSGGKVIVLGRLVAQEEASVTLEVSWSSDGNQFVLVELDDGGESQVALPGEGAECGLAFDAEGLPEGPIFVRVAPVGQPQGADVALGVLDRSLEGLVEAALPREEVFQEEVFNAFAIIGVGEDDLALPSVINGEFYAQPEVGVTQEVVGHLQDPMNLPANMLSQAQAMFAQRAHLAESLKLARRLQDHPGLSEPYDPLDLFTSEPLMDALDGIFAESGEAFEAREEVAAQVASWPLFMRRALATLILASRDAASDVEAANAGFNVESERVGLNVLVTRSSPGFGRFGELMARYDQDVTAEAGALRLGAAQRMAYAVESARWALMQAPADLQGVVLSVELPFGLVLVTGHGDDTHTTSAALHVDLGGDDVYDGAAAASTMGGGEVSWVIDVRGDDLYGDDRSLWSAGAGVFGVAGLVDFEGNDTYRGAHFGQGFGLHGVGILYDGAGDDEYAGETHLQGVGVLGIGLAIDVSGRDSRAVSFGGQGMGARTGLGAIVDGGGDDTYTITREDYNLNNFYRQKWEEAGYPGHGYLSFAQGAGVGAFANLIPSSEISHGGGVGVIFDRDGQDRYEGADQFGLALGYYYGLGAVVDFGGDDVYDAWDYTMGAGQHVGAGLLLDLGGDDAYGLSVDHAQGHGLDMSLGVLLDFEGDDTYLAVQNSQGTGVQVGAVGIMADLDGADRYGNSLSSNQGWARELPEDPFIERPSTSCFLDLGGDADTYSRIGASDDATWHNEQMTSVGRDLP